jgi:hypothetical protein
MSGRTSKILNLITAIVTIFLIMGLHLAGSTIAVEAGLFVCAFVLAVNKFLVIE